MMSKPSRAGWRLSSQAWLGLLALGLLLWLTIIYAGLLVEILWVLFGALLLSMTIYPTDASLGKRVLNDTGTEGEQDASHEPEPVPTS